ncbi:exodeoxyribonuclease V subunit beta [Pusillimonas sp. NJUB218]|uniref:UvrD-helicase domain-containing protein n=1 Tax=Pusillimonas sp. NJUB218 TaxID=2023230 RepID=UPI000F4C834F|nr:UvrD-helicase domain-containing protein [Pusillimonas sp. NJUB218]ROT45954.1 nuclease [Pusillimonas sp. NJUB218]
MSEPIHDAAARQQALDPQRSFLVQAPAGSGKTELLTDRILALLATVERPEEIVAITFTRKAASEMHARVLLKLGQGLGPEPPEAHRRESWRLARAAIERDRQMGWQLLQYPARLSIRTIDAFCAHLVRGMPWLSTMGGMPGVCDDAGRYYREAAQATIGLVDDVESVARVLAHLDVDLRAAETLLAEMLGSRDQWMPLLDAGSDARLLSRFLAETIDEDVARLAVLMPVGWSHDLAVPCRTAADILAQEGKMPEVLPLVDWSGAPFDTSQADLPRWQALAALLLTKDGRLRKTVNKATGFEAKSDHRAAFMAWLQHFDGTEPWVSALAEIRTAPAQGYQDWQLDVLSDLLEVLRLAWAQLMVQFSQAGEVDFIEVSQRALRALGSADDPTDLLLSLDGAIRHLLVDEFQDTSQAQIELLERLTSGWMPDDGRTLFLVGDPMQSIYRFRKAEVGLFLKVREAGLGQVPLTSLQLTTNFRSQTSVVDWVNSVFGPLFPAAPHIGLGAIPYSSSVAFNPPLDGLGVSLHPVWSVGEEGADESGMQEAAQTVVQLARDALARNPDSGHPVAILVRARSHLKDVVRQLTSQGIPCRAVELVSLKTRQVVADLVQLARALSHPGDRLAWLSVLRSPLCGLRLHTLHALFGQEASRPAPLMLADYVRDDDPAAWGVDQDEHQRVLHAAAVLLDRTNDEGVVPFASWLQTAWQQLGGSVVYATQDDEADSQAFFRLIERLAPFGGLDPAELEIQLDKLFAKPGHQAGPAVEVMTIHKSKGLQFDTVILMGLHHGATSDSQRLVHFEFSEGRLLIGPIRPKASEQADPITTYLREREKKRSAYEIDRLLYVAATRARHQLCLVAQLSLDKNGEVAAPRAGSLLSRLWPYISPPSAPEITAMSPGSFAGVIDAATDGRPLLRLPSRALPAPDKSVFALSSDAGRPWEWSQALNEDALVGTVAHAWLERLGKAGADTWTVEGVRAQEPVVRRQLSRAGVPGDRLDATAAAVCETLEATLSSARGRWLLGLAKAYREWSLLDVSGRVSVIDLAVSDEQGWLVVDYKTGRPQDGESADQFADRMRVRYAEQMARYRAQVSALDGRPARSALYFPRADIWIDD